MNLVEFLKTGVITAGILLPFVMSIVTLGGKFGLTGKAQLAFALVTGLILGGLGMYVQVLPVDLSGWVQVVVVGLVTGLGATGVYDVLKTSSEKGAEQANIVQTQVEKEQPK